MARDLETLNPVVDSAAFAFEHTALVTLNTEGIQAAAKFIYKKICSESYRPQSWCEQPLHIIPPTPFDPFDPKTKLVLDYIFLVSALNFSFWSDKEFSDGCFGIEWRQSWIAPQSPKRVWTGYWSLLAAINKAIESKIPITDPFFYSSPSKCPDSIIIDMFRPAANCKENIPLLKERIAIMREVGSILCSRFGGSYYNLLSEAQNESGPYRRAIHVVRKVVEAFPSFRDEVAIDGRPVYFWKRAQILVAETWAAFHPEDPRREAHPLFPEGVSELTMFADYRVPQILNQFKVIDYSITLRRALQEGRMLPPGSREEVSIRSASILAVERIRDAIREHHLAREDEAEPRVINSVLIDFWLWDTAKKMECKEVVLDLPVREQLPTHRTRSIWY